MSKWLVATVLAMMILASAVGLKGITVASTSAPVPPAPLGKHFGSCAARSLGKHFGPGAARSLGKHISSGASRTLELTSGGSR